MASGSSSTRFNVEEAIAMILDSEGMGDEDKGMSSGEEYKLNSQLGIYSDELR